MVAARTRYGEAVELSLDGATVNGRLVENLRERLSPHRNAEGLPVRLRYRNPVASGWLELGEQWRVAPTDELLITLRDVEGQDGVRLKYR